MRSLLVVLLLSQMTDYVAATALGSRPADPELSPGMAAPEGLPNRWEAANAFFYSSHDRVHKKYGLLGVGPNPFRSGEDEKRYRDPLMTKSTGEGGFAALKAFLEKNKED